MARAVAGATIEAANEERKATAVDSTMMDVPLTVGMILRHGVTVHGDSEVVTWTGDGARSATYAQIGRRAAQLASALRELGVTGDQRVATFQWNNQEHLEAYLAIPAMGAVVHTLNLRLPPDQVAWIANHAEDDLVIVDGSLVPVLGRALPEMKTVRHVVVVGPAGPRCVVPGRVGAARGGGYGRRVVHLQARQPGGPLPAAPPARVGGDQLPDGRRAAAVAD